MNGNNPVQIKPNNNEVYSQAYDPAGLVRETATGTH